MTTQETRPASVAVGEDKPPHIVADLPRISMREFFHGGNISIDKDVVDAYTSLFEHGTVEFQRAEVKRLQKITWQQTGNR